MLLYTDKPYRRIKYFKPIQQTQPDEIYNLGVKSCGCFFEEPGIQLTLML